MLSFLLLFSAINVLIAKSASNISCPIKQPCTIDCDSESCQHATINATLSAALTVSCGNCEHAVIICPVSSSNTNCTINFAEGGRDTNTSFTTRRSSFLSIFSESNNTMQVNVDHESAFHHSTIVCGTNSVCLLNCNSVETCLNIAVNATYNTSMFVKCNGVNSCNYLDGINSIQSVGNDKSLNIQCAGYTRCNWKIFNISGDILMNTTAESFYSYYNLPLFVHIDSPNSNSVQIYIDNTTFVSVDGIYLNNSQSIELNVGNKPANIYGLYTFGGHGYFEGSVYGQNSKEFNLFCGGHKESCAKGKYYISSTDSKIICDDYGCWDLEIYAKNGLDKNVVIVRDNNCLCDANSSASDNSCVSNWDIFCGDEYKDKSVFSNGKECTPATCCGDVVEETKGQFVCRNDDDSINISDAGRILIVVFGFVGLCLISSGCYWLGTRKSDKIKDEQQKEAFIN